MATRRKPAVAEVRDEPAPELIPLPEAARRCRVSDRTFRRYISTGLINATRIGPRLLMIDPRELAKLYQPVGSGS